ncbi:MAG: GrpB family protein [Pseudomonadota bacterium]
MNIEVVPHNPDWKRNFEDEKKLLTGRLGTLVARVHHIGSTSVPGLAAKPIIDMILEVPDLADLDSARRTFLDLGYEVMGEYGIPGRRYFRKGGDRRTHHIHAFEVGDANVDRHVAFRDYLMAHPAERLAYENLKIQLAREADNDIDRYCDGKEDFVKFHEAKALLWTANAE